MPCWLNHLSLLIALSFGAARSPAQVTNGMARIPAGMFQPFFVAPTDAKDVPVRAFLLDVLPVTNGEFLEFVHANPAWRKSNVKRIFADESYLKNWSADLDPGADAPLNAPVTFVSWFAAKAFGDWKGKRLPTVAEWEYAAAAGFDGPNGASEPAFKAQVERWYASPSPTHLPAVGGARANFWGMRDMHGLIWEWVSDFNTAMVTGDARSDAALDRQLFCGAGAQGARDAGNFPAFMRYGFRSSLKADYCVHNLGFRCAKDL